MTAGFLTTIAVVLAALAVWVLRARATNPINYWFAAYTFGLAAWTMALGILHAGLTTEFSARLVFAAASFLPGSFLAFSHVYPTSSRWPPMVVVRAVIFIGALFSLLSLTTPLLVYDAVLTPAGFTRKSGILYPAFSLYFLAAWLTALGLLVTKWRRSRGHARAQLQYLGIGLIIHGAGGLSANLLFPLLLGIASYTWLGPFFTLPLVILVGHAIIRHRLMDLRLVMHRGIVYSVAIGLIATISVVATRLFAPIPIQSLFLHPDLSVVLLVVLLMLSTPVQHLLGRIIDPYLYRGRLDYASALSAATRRLSHLMQPSEVAAELQAILSQALVPESYVMVVRSFSSNEFEELSADNAQAIDLLKTSSAVRELVRSQPSPSLLLVNPSADAFETKAAHNELRDAGIELLMTLGRRGGVLGAVLLGPRRSGDAYFDADLALIESLSELASIALENALLYRQRVQMLEYSDRLLESLNSAVVAVDVDGRITSFNRAALHLLGLQEKDRGALLAGLPSEVAWALALAIRDAWPTREIEVAIEHASHGLLPVMLSTAVLRDDQRRVTGGLVVVTDLSVIKELERNQRRVEHLGMMARFYTGIAHEIRSPLASISNFIAMLPDRFDDPEYRDTAVRLLPIEVARITRLADRLRLMAPSEGGKLSMIELPALLTDIVAIHSTAAATHGVKIILRCPAPLPRIRGDQGQLVQLFVNLVNNAIEAMPRGGMVTIEANKSDNVTAESAVIVRVVDEGAGIDPEIRPKVFQPFFTTKSSGTGLGLSICREIAEFHRAHLSLFPRVDSNGTIAQIEFQLPSEEIIPGTKASTPT